MTNRYTRRAFLATTGAAGVAAVLSQAGAAFGAAGAPATRGAAVGTGANRKAVASLDRSEFAPLVGSKFRMANGPAAQSVVLESVADLSGGRSEGRFSLIFKGSKAAAWQQGVYVLSHRSIGRAGLLVVPVDRGAKGRRYQVIVNRG